MDKEGKKDKTNKQNVKKKTKNKYMKNRRKTTKTQKSPWSRKVGRNKRETKKKTC